MNTTVKVISVDGDVWRFSNTNKKLILKKGAKLQAKDVLHLSEESNVVLQLSNGRVVEIHGKDLINNDGNFSLNSLLVESNSDIDKIVNFAKSFQQMNESEQQNDVVRLDDGRVFKKEGKDYVEIAGESFEGDPDVTQGGHRFVQLTRAGETSVADGIKPLMLNRVVDNIPPLGIQYPILSSVIKPFEHGLGGGSWTPLSPFAPTPNTPPVASDDTYNTAFNTPVTLNPLANDTDADGNPLTITAINGVPLTPGSAQQINTPNGVVNIDAQGNITFTPNAGFTGQESFNYSISDGQGGSATATETINVSAAPNTPPVASDDTYNTAFNTPVTLNPLANDTDADGNPLTITAINGVTLTPGTAQQINTPNGVVNIDAQGNITFTPNAGFTGQESFNYSISDGQGGSATATGTINVSAAPNTPPVASDDTYNTAFNTPVTLNPLANDTDADGNPLTITAINGVTLTPGTAQQINTPNGVVNIDAQGNITFTPNAGFTGQESFSYSISDGQGGSATATETINVSAAPNTPPVASDDTYNTAFNTPVTLNPLANDTDADGNPLTITAINGVPLTPGSAQQINTPNGVVNIDAQGNITFTPNAGFTGQESFNYSISDGQGGSATATETINVSAAPNTPPVASDDTYNTAFNTPVTLNPLANDTDADGNPLTITAINGVTLTPGTAQQINTPNGVVNIDAQGNITFTPNAGFTGQESFNYSISDGQGGSATATETINVSAAPNTPPVASDDTYNTAFNTPVTLNPLANDTDADGNPLTITAINGVTLTPGTAQQINTPNGVVNIDAQGNITFTPNAGFTGQESFNYSISDGQGGSATATETINVSAAPNTPPVASDDTYNTAFNTPVTLNPLANDTDADGNPLTITAINGVPLTPGSAQQINTPNGVVNIDAQGNITFTPNAGFTGQESFSYSISDGQGGSATATETINVSAAPNTPPVASDDTYNTAFNTPVTLNPLANDSDADGNPLTITAINGVPLTPGSAQQINTPNGVVNIDAQGNITFTPNAGFTGQESFSYSISDGQGGSATATETINVDAVPTISVGNNTQVEGTNLVHTVTLSNPSSTAQSYAISLTGNSATAGTDFDNNLANAVFSNGVTYDAGTGQITVPAGVTSFTVGYTTTQDNIHEADETTTLTIGGSTGTGTITNDDAVPTISVGNNTQVEGTNLVHTVTLSNPSSTAQSYAISLTGNSATAGTDFDNNLANAVFSNGVTYDAGTGQITVPAGVTSFTVGYTTTQDNIHEADETTTLTIGGSTGTGTITNDDAVPTISVGNNTQVEGTNLVHTVTLSNPSSTAQSYAISLTGNTATAGTDFDNNLANAVFSNGVTYDAGTGQITVPAGVTSFTVGYTTTQDNIHEADETTTLTIGGSTGTGTITNDDAVPTISVGNNTQVEGTNLVHTVTLSNPSSTAQSYAISLTGNTATAGTDFDNNLANAVFSNGVTYDAGTGQITVPAGVTSFTVGYTTTQDNIHEADETTTLTIGGSTGTGTITNDDAVPTISVGNNTQVEGTNLVHTVTLSNPSSTAQSYAISLTGNSATAGTDFDNNLANAVFSNGVTYDAGTGQITVPAGVTSFTVGYTTTQDNIHEADETTTLTIGGSTGTGTITNDDAVPTISVGNNTQVEGTNLVHTVTLSNPSSTAQSYAISLTGNSATAGTDFDNNLANAVFSNGVTYDAGTGQITVPAGVTSFTVGYTTTQDNIHEADETTTLTIGGSTGTGTITNDDAVPTISVGNNTQVEGTNLVHTVTLSNPSSTAQSYAISLTGNSATAGTDFDNNLANAVFSNGVTYDAGTGQITVPAGVTSFTVGYTTTQDNIHEADETTTLTIGGSTGTGTITNDDAVPTISVGNNTQVEGTNLVHTVTLSNPSSTAQSYAISLTGNSATAGTDFDNNLANAVFSNGVTYDAGTGQITVPAGVTSFTVGYTTTQDNIHEADETTTLTIGGSTGTGTITNDDAPTLLAGSARVSEEGLVGGLADSNGNDLTNSRTFNGSLVVANVETTVGLTYAFTGVPSDVLTSNGVAVVWTLDTATNTVTGTAGALTIITVVLDSATGDYTVTLDGAVDHADNSVEDILDFTIPTKVTGNHNVSDTSTLTVIVEDDSPVITPTNAANSLQVDETNFVSGSVSVTDINFGKSAFTVNYGADDAAVSNSLLYSLGVSAVGVSSGLRDTATNQLVYLYIESGTGDVIGRVGASGNPNPSGAEAFRIHVDASTGSTTLTQKRPLNHSVDGTTLAAHDDVLTLAAGAVRLTAVATDRDGDSASQTVAVGDKFSFKDDGLTLAVTGNTGSITVDESALIGGVGNPNPAILATMTNSTFLNGVFTPTYGTDGAATTNPLVYSLRVASAGVNSGLVDTATGQAILLYKESNDIVGRVGSNTGAEAFRIQMNATSGSTTLTQSRSLSHGTDGSTATDHNDALSIANNAVVVRAVAMDGDGDTARRDVRIGNKFSFLDDGPVFVSSTTATVDEADLPLGSSPTPSALTQSGTLTINFGADKGTASQVDVQFTAATLTALENWDNTATGGEANNENLTFAISNAGHTITATDSVSGLPAFTVTLTVDKATGATSYEFVLSRALAHNNLPELHIPFNNLLITDGDGDTTLGNFSVTVVDDEPSVLDPKVLIVNEDLTNDGGFGHGAPDSNTFNTNADATGVNTAIDGGANAPQHGVAVVNANGTITYTPNTHYSGQDTFTYTTTTDQGTKTYTVNVTVRPITNDVPTIGHAGESNGTHPHFVYTLEDTDVLLGLKAPVITDPTDQNGAITGDHPERLGVITLTLSGAGAVAGTELLKGGTALIPTVANGSVFTVVIVDSSGSTTPSTSYHHAGVPSGAANINYLTVAEYEAITVSPALHRHENFNVNVSVTEYEVNDSGLIVSTPDNGTNGRPNTETIFVSVEAVTDDAQLIFNTTAPLPTNVDAVTYGGAGGNTAATVTIKEETSIIVNDMLAAQFDDLDDTEVRSITITNTTGQDIVINGSTLVNGASVTVNDNAGGAGQTGGIGSFPNITIGAAGDFSGDLNNIILTINAQDYDADGYYHDHDNNSGTPLVFAPANPATLGVPEADTHDADPLVNNNTVVLNLRVTPVAGDVAAGNVSTAEDTAVAFLQHVRVTDTGTGDERINTVSFTVPTDWKVLDASGITGFGTDFTAPSGNVTSGTYTITFINAALTELQREAILDQFMIQPPAHSSKDLPAADFQVSINSTDTNTVNGSLVTDTATKIIGIGITVTPTAEALALTGNVTITASTTDYYATAADNPANWTAMDTDFNAANANVDGGLTPDLSMNGNFSYVTNGFEDTWFALNTDGFDFETPWRNEDGVGSGGANGNKENTFAVLTAYEVVRDAGGIITGLNPIAGEFRHSGSTAFASEVDIQFLDSVEFKGPEGFSGEVFIKVQARTKDYDEDTNAEVIQDSGVAWLKDILLEPVADDVTLQVNIREVMDEDTSRALTIRTQTTDLDGSETFNIQIQGIPVGSKIEFNGHVYDTLDSSTWNNGGDQLVAQGGGLYTLELYGLPQGTINPIFTPPKDSNTNGSNINLTVEAVSVDTITISGGPNAGTYTHINPVTSTQTIAISVIGVPDAPLVTIVDGQTWVENDLDEHNGGSNSAAADGDPNVIDLSNFITAATLGETNPLNPSVNSETLTLRITNLPEGFSLVDAATGNPIITLAGGSGDARVWVLTPAQIATTQIKTPVNFSGTENFTVEPVVTENDGRATKFGPPQVAEFHVTPSPEATLNLASNVWEDVDDGTYGHANQIGQISLSVLPQNGDSTNEEIYAVRFSEAEVLAAGMILYSDAAGTTPLVATGGYYYVTGVANVQNVYVRSDENFSGDVALTVDYIVRDTSIDGTPAPNETIYTGGGNAPTWTSFQSISHVLHFRPLTDDVDLTIPSLTSPTATISGTHATLAGDGLVTVNLNTAKVPDATASNTIDYDGSEHMNYFLIQNVPDGVTVIGAVNTGAGQWLITDTTSFTGALADSVQFDVNYDAVGNITDWPITITAVTQDGTAPEKTDTETWTLTTVAGPGTILVPPEIDLTPLNPTKIEDTPFALSDVVSGDIDSSMATITSPYQVTLTIRMDPADTTTFTGMGSRIVVIEGGNPVAIWTKTFTTDATNADADLAAAIASVTVIPASDANQNTNNLNGPLPFDITASIQAGGATDSDQVVSNVDLTPVTDYATLTTTSTAVDEGGIIPVNVTVTHDKDETGDWIIAGNNLYLEVVDGPDTVIQGDLQYWDGASWITVTPTLVTGTGTTLDGQNYYIVPNVSPNTLQQLRYVVTHNNDAEYENGTFTLNAFAINQEFDSTTLVSMGSTPLTVNQVNTPLDIDIVATDNEHDGSGAMAVGSIQLAITETLMPADVNENLYSALIQNLPNGFLVYYGADQNSATLATNAGDGTWVIPVSGNDLPPYISIKPPAYWSGTLSSAVFSLVSGEASLPANVTDFPFNLIVTPVADGIFQFVPTYSFADVGEPLVLNLNVGMQDPVSVTDDDPAAAPDEYHELTTLKFRNIPDGAATVFLANNALINPSLITYDAGTGEHTITGLTQAQLDNFQILHEGTAGRVLIEVDAQTYEVETATGAVVSPPSAWVMKSFEINVTGGNRVDGTPAGDIMSGTADNDYINGHGGDDTISGDSGNDALLGETGNDILNGGTGTDYLYGGADNDTLNGGAGNDFLQGGTGNDILYGNDGADLFIWGGGDADGSTDIIKDFNLAEGDKVDAKALLDALGWNGNMGTLSQFVSVTGNTIDIHNAADTISVNIVVEGQTFTDLNDMIVKTNFQTT